MGRHLTQDEVVEMVRKQLENDYEQEIARLKNRVEELEIYEKIYQKLSVIVALPKLEGTK